MARHHVLAAALLACVLGARAGAQTREEDHRESVRTPDAGKATEAPDLARVAEMIVTKTNEFRKKEKREPVAVDKKLAATVQYFAGYMARENEYGHTADGKRPSERAKAHGYDYCIVAENIAYVFDPKGFTAEQLADKFTTGWKESPEHRKNMLDADVTETAVAVARSEKTGHYYAVQMFGRPKSAAIKFDIGNDSGEAVKYAIGDQTFDLPPGVTRTHTVCRAVEAAFRWPGSDEAKATVTPAAGDTFTVTKGDGGFAVKKKAKE